MRKTGIIVLLLSVNLLWAEEMAQPIRVGLLLPLQTGAAQRDKSMDRFADFYTGALMAVYDVQATGQQVEVYTWDVGKSVSQLEQVLSLDTLDRMDMIIGPVYSAQVRHMASWTALHHVLTLIPFDYEINELASNPYLLQFNPSESTEAEAMVNYLFTQQQPVRLVFIQSDEAAMPASVRTLLHCVRAEGLEYTYTSVRQIMADSLADVLRDDAENIMVMNTERYANLRQVMPYLERAAQGKSLTLMSRYSWQDEPIILPQLYVSSFRKNVDVDQVSYGALYRRYVAKERVLSRPCYDLLGRDMMAYVLETVQMLRQADEDDRQAVIERGFVGLQSDMRFERVNDQGGYQNINLHVVRVQ